MAEGAGRSVAVGGEDGANNGAGRRAVKGNITYVAWQYCRDRDEAHDSGNWDDDDDLAVTAFDYCAVLRAFLSLPFASLPRHHPLPPLHLPTTPSPTSSTYLLAATCSTGPAHTFLGIAYQPPLTRSNTGTPVTATSAI